MLVLKRDMQKIRRTVLFALGRGQQERRKNRRDLLKRRLSSMGREVLEERVFKVLGGRIAMMLSLMKDLLI